MVERYFFAYPLNARQEADFSHAKVELKCTPLKASSNQELKIKERLVCSMINYTTDWSKPFEESSFYLKCYTMLLLFYLHSASKSKLDLKFLFSVL